MKTRFPVIWTNFISDKFCAKIAMLDTAEAVALYSWKLDTGASFTEKWGIKKSDFWGNAPMLIEYESTDNYMIYEIAAFAEITKGSIDHLLYLEITEEVMKTDNVIHIEE